MSRTFWPMTAMLLALLLSSGSVRGDAPRLGPLARAERDFLDRHWRGPLAPQGEPPASFSPLERSLAPVDCGACHPAQFADWRNSLHSKSMGPGIAGQLVEMMRDDPAAARSCLTCHAPLAEQAMQVAAEGGYAPNPVFDAGLRPQGLVCAGCHVRGHQRFGPPRRDRTSHSLPRAALPHNGFTPTTAFLRSEFCATCHQFTPDGFAVNGKLLENTFEEWRASPAARRGQQCQDCHMPGRRHLWRGIHDPEMVKSGVRIDLVTGRARYRPGDQLRATLTIANTGVGHNFPTYVTPRVLARAELFDQNAGESVPQSVEERAIGRDVPLDLSREIADTRIPPGGRFVLKYNRRLERAGLSLRVTVTVFPDHFYTGFFEALLAGGAGAGQAQIQEALEASRRSSFVIFSRDLPLT